MSVKYISRSDENFILRFVRICGGIALVLFFSVSWKLALAAIFLWVAISFGEALTQYKSLR